MLSSVISRAVLLLQHLCTLHNAFYSIRQRTLEAILPVLAGCSCRLYQTTSRDASSERLTLLSRPTVHWQANPSISEPQFSSRSRIDSDQSTSPSASAQNLSIYPFTLIVLLIWVAFIASLILVLELSVRRSPTSGDQLWWPTDLPSALLTGFAQGHSAITAMHLARLGISALQKTATSPACWAELFWIADRDWQGPLGLFRVLMALRRVKSRRLSMTFILFSLTCLVALSTPISLSRAYHLKTSLSTDLNCPTKSSTHNIILEKAFRLSSEDHESYGLSRWITGSYPSELYHHFTYTNPTSHGEQEDGMRRSVFSTPRTGSFRNASSFYLAGGCRDIYWDGKTSLLDPGLDTLVGACLKPSSVMPATEPIQLSGSDAGDRASFRVSVSPCCTYQPASDKSSPSWMLSTAAHRAQAIVPFEVVVNNTLLHKTIIHCDVRSGPGIADLIGSLGVWTQLEILKNYDSGAATSSSSVHHPLYASLALMSHHNETPQLHDSNDHLAILKAQYLYGLKPIMSPDENTFLYWSPPTPSQFADRLWVGTQHMAATLAELSMSTPWTPWEHINTPETIPEPCAMVK